MTIYTANANRITPSAKSFKVLSFIAIADGATKFECVSKVLGRQGSKRQLRGYYCAPFRGWMESGVLIRNDWTHEYHITTKGRALLKAATQR